jgi:hypothetical protein
VQAYRGRGAGRYALTPTCTGGPCAGQVGHDDLELLEREACIDAARLCAFEDMAPFNGAVGPSRARTLFQNCLTRGTVAGQSCSAACDDDDAKEICEGIIATMPFYADQSPACLDTLAGCMDDCADATDEDATPDEFWSTVLGICWMHGLNGSCDSFARDTVECGGTLARESHDRCMQECASTTGAWIDDLDTMCDEACEDLQ